MTDLPGPTAGLRKSGTAGRALRVLLESRVRTPSSSTKLASAFACLTPPEPAGIASGPAIGALWPRRVSCSAGDRRAGVFTQNSSHDACRFTAGRCRVLYRLAGHQNSYGIGSCCRYIHHALSYSRPRPHEGLDGRSSERREDRTAHTSTNHVMIPEAVAGGMDPSFLEVIELHSP
jgi:hypothetical protein